MKKKLLILLAILIVMALAIAAWFYGYYHHKNWDNIPSKEIMLGYLKEQGEGYATEKIEGYTREAILYIWDEPDGALFGRWGDVWEIENGESIIVYYDVDGKVADVKLAD